MEITRIADYEYEVVINGHRTTMNLEDLVRLLSSLVERKSTKNEMEEFWESEPAYPEE